MFKQVYQLRWIPCSSFNNLQLLTLLAGNPMFIVNFNSIRHYLCIHLYIVLLDTETHIAFTTCSSEAGRVVYSNGLHNILKKIRMSNRCLFILQRNMWHTHLQCAVVMWIKCSRIPACREERTTFLRCSTLLDGFLTLYIRCSNTAVKLEE